MVTDIEISIESYLQRQSFGLYISVENSLLGMEVTRKVICGFFWQSKH
jgi:hypothetical protein